MGKSNQPADVFRFIDTKDNDTTKCWPWTGSLGGRDGRGYITINGKKELSYRVVYELFNGPLTEGQVVRHECDNPQCCNPTHLVTGTRRDNELDKYKRGRAGVPLHIVTEIHRLRREAKRGGLSVSNKYIADTVNARYGTNMAQSTVSRILSGTSRAAQKKQIEEENDDEGNT